jgi:hypothetical protein
MLGTQHSGPFMKTQLRLFRRLLVLTVALFVAPSSRAGDIKDWVVNKHQQFTQNNSGAPVFRNPGTPYQFEAAVNSTASDVITGLSVRLPGGSTQVGSPYTDEVGYGYDVSNEYSSLATLDAVYPTGSYVLTISTVHDGVKTVTNSLPASVYPNTPHVSNYDAAQAMNPVAGFTLTWDAFTGGTAGDIIQVKIDDPSNNTIFSSGFTLTGTSTSIVIPANTLAPNQTYEGSVGFYKFISVNSNSIPGAVGRTVFWKKTRFNLQTTLPPGVFSIASGNTAIEFSSSAAFDGTNYLVAFTRGTNVSAQRIAPDGSLLGPLITDIGAATGTLKVAHGNTNSLMVWYDDFAVGANKFGQIISDDGIRVGPAFELSPDSEGGLRGLAFDGSNFLVLMETTTDRGFYGQLVDQTGLLGNATDVINTDPYGSHDAAIACDGTNYLVVWDAQGTPSSDIYGQFIDRDGGLVGNNFVIDADGLPSDNPMDVIFDGTRYFITFSDEIGGQGTENWDTFGRFVTTDGIVLTNRISIATGSGAQRFPQAAFDGINYLVSWNSGLATTNSDIKYRFFDKNGKVMSSEFSGVSPQGTNRPTFGDILFNGTKYFAVATLGVITTNFQTLSADVYGTFISPLPGGIFPVATNNSIIEVSFSAAFDGTNYLVGVQGGPQDHDEVIAQLVSRSGALIGPGVSTGRFGSIPQVAFDGTNYFMVWQDATNTGGIYGQFIDRSGALINQAFPVTTNPAAQDPDLDPMRPIAYGAGKYLVVYNDNRTGTKGIYGQLVSISGALSGAEIVISQDSLSSQEASVAFDGTNFLVVWQKRTAAIQEQYDTRGVFISPSGNKGTPFVISQTTSARHNPLNLVFNGNNYFVVWNRDVGPGFPSPTQWDLYARFVSPGGAFPGSEIALVTGTNQPVVPGLAFDGTNYLMSWNGGGFASTSSEMKFQFFNAAAQSIGAPFSIFLAKGTNVPFAAGVLFDGTRFVITATLANVDSNFNFYSADIYGTFLTVNEAPLPLVAPGNGSIVVSGTDFEGDGDGDILWYSKSQGQLVLWTMNEGNLVATTSFPSIGSGWNFGGLADFNGDMSKDILWQNDNGQLEIWFMSGTSLVESALVGTPAAGWQAVGAADFNGDTRSDIVLQHTSGTTAVWLMNGTNFLSSISLRGGIPPGEGYRISGVNDFNGDNQADILLVNTNGQQSVWFMNGTNFASEVLLRGGTAAPLSWRARGIGDFNSDNQKDILWQDTNTGSVYLWYFNGTTFVDSATLLTASSVKPVILSQPENQSVNAGESASFFVSASGAALLKYQWRRNGTPLEGATTSALTLDHVSSGSAGNYSVIITNSSGSVTSAIATLTINLPAPILSLSSNTYTVMENGGWATVTVQKNPYSSATFVNYTTSNDTAYAFAEGIGDYQTTSGTLTFAEGETSKSLIIPIVDNPVSDGNRSFNFVLSSSDTNVTLEIPSTATISIIDDDPATNTNSTTGNSTPGVAIPQHDRQLTIVLRPAGSGQWRLRQETAWRNGGQSAKGLTTGNYAVQFKQVPGFIQPADALLAVTADATNVYTFAYTAITGAPLYGGLQVLINPEEVANTNFSPHGQWRVQGETNWQNSEDVLTNLLAGTNNVIEFSPVIGFATPAARRVLITADQINTISAGYSPASSTGRRPDALSFTNATGTARDYGYNGQLISEVGYGSGCVVKRRVVLTAAHVVFDDVNLVAASRVLWFFQRYQGTYEPPPKRPRGWYMLDGYAAARTNDSSPGVSSLASQNLDAAALYFVEDAGRGIFSGYLASEPAGIEWLLQPASKTLIGYPVEATDQTIQPGRMYATPWDVTVNFILETNRVFSTTNIHGYPGMSGGSLCVQSTNGIYYPAGIYLGGTEQKSIVRVIDGTVADLINQADNSSYTAQDHSGGGVIQISPDYGNTPFASGYVRIWLGPPAAVQAGGAWRVVDRGIDWTSDANIRIPLVGGPFSVEFKSVSGWVSPTNRPVQLSVDQASILLVNYQDNHTATCSYSLSTNTQFFNFVGGSSSVNVFSAATCAWTVTNTNSWVTLTSSANGVGNREVAFNVATNNSPLPRTARLTIAGKTFTVSQAAGYSIGGFRDKLLYLTITNGAGTLPSTGKYLVVAGSGTANTFRIVPMTTNISSETGLYFYTRVNNTKAELNLGGRVIVLNFTSGSAGSFQSGIEGGAQGGVFVLANAPADFNNDGLGDVFFQQTNGTLLVWQMSGTNFLGAKSPNKSVGAAWRMVGQDDFNRDGKIDFLFRDGSARLSVWFMNGTNFLSAAFLRNGVAMTGWNVVGLNDFNRDGNKDILFQHTDGRLSVWFMNGTNYLSGSVLRNGQPAAPGWKAAGAQDLNGDGYADILFQNTTDGSLAAWLMIGAEYSSSVALRAGPAPSTGWKLRGLGDFNLDGRTDLLWQNPSNALVSWLFNKTAFISAAPLRNGQAIASVWSVVGPK